MAMICASQPHFLTTLFHFKIWKIWSAAGGCAALLALVCALACVAVRRGWLPGSLCRRAVSDAPGAVTPLQTWRQLVPNQHRCCCQALLFSSGTKVDRFDPLAAERRSSGDSRSVGRSILGPCLPKLPLYLNLFTMQMVRRQSPHLIPFPKRRSYRCT